MSTCSSSSGSRWPEPLRAAPQGTGGDPQAGITHGRDTPLPHATQSGTVQTHPPTRPGPRWLWVEPGSPEDPAGLGDVCETPQTAAPPGAPQRKATLTKRRWGPALRLCRRRQCPLYTRSGHATGTSALHGAGTRRLHVELPDIKDPKSEGTGEAEHAGLRTLQRFLRCGCRGHGAVSAFSFF